ncbi:hypothetical protein ACVWYH_006238 [Bradyrhizobium sp. GM24.11]
MANKPPNKEFGKRRPAPQPSAPREPVKRSGHVALLVMGTIAVGATAYTLMPRRSCDPSPSGASVPAASVPGAAAPMQTTNCSSSSSSSGSHWSSRSSFYSSDSSSHSSSGTSSDSSSGAVTRGGFGSFAHGFSGGG